MTPQGMPGFDMTDPKSQWLPESVDLVQVKQLVAHVPNPRRKVRLWYDEDPGHKAIAVAVQAQWRKLGRDISGSRGKRRTRRCQSSGRGWGPPARSTIFRAAAAGTIGLNG